MKKLLFLLGILSIVGICTNACASKNDQKEPFTYVEVGSFIQSKKYNSIIIAYGTRNFYPHNLAIDGSLLTAVGFNGDFVVAYKYTGLLYLSPIKSTVTPYVGIGGIAGMISIKGTHKHRSTQICANALAVLGAQIDLKEHTHLLSATYYLNSNSILLSVGKAF